VHVHAKSGVETLTHLTYLAEGRQRLPARYKATLEHTSLIVLSIQHGD